MIGRALVGFGSAETANRVIIASSVPKQYISFLSGLFVVAGALGNFPSLFSVSKTSISLFKLNYNRNECWPIYSRNIGYLSWA